jgi:hypothetical protein
LSNLLLLPFEIRVIFRVFIVGQLYIFSCHDCFVADFGGNL